MNQSPHGNPMNTLMTCMKGMFIDLSAALAPSSCWMVRFHDSPIDDVVPVDSEPPTAEDLDDFSDTLDDG